MSAKTAAIFVAARAAVHEHATEREIVELEKVNATEAAALYVLSTRAASTWWLSHAIGRTYERTRHILASIESRGLVIRTSSKPLACPSCGAHARGRTKSWHITEDGLVALEAAV